MYCIKTEFLGYIALLYQEADMPADTQPSQRLVSLFTKQPCWMIEPLAAEMDYSIPSVRRFLSRTGYYSSFTHNGKWYTFRSIPRFSRDGLWFYRDIGFSRAGSLPNTLIELTSHSLAGMTAEMLGEKLRCRCHTILVQLCRKGKLQREKAGRSHVYLAADPHTATGQRRAMALKDLPPAPLPAEIAVLVLVAFIRNPQASFKQLAKTLSTTQNVTVDAVQIERFFDLHGLKKTT
jgi:predicted transcriptional regulator